MVRPHGTHHSVDHFQDPDHGHKRSGPCLQERGCLRCPEYTVYWQSHRLEVPRCVPAIVEYELME